MLTDKEQLEIVLSKIHKDERGWFATFNIEVQQKGLRLQAVF